VIPMPQIAGACEIPREFLLWPSSAGDGALRYHLVKTELAECLPDGKTVYHRDYPVVIGVVLTGVNGSATGIFHPIPSGTPVISFSVHRK